MKEEKRQMESQKQETHLVKLMSFIHVNKTWLFTHLLRSLLIRSSLSASAGRVQKTTKISKKVFLFFMSKQHEFRLSVILSLLFHVHFFVVIVVSFVFHVFFFLLFSQHRMKVLT